MCCHTFLAAPLALVLVAAAPVAWAADNTGTVRGSLRAFQEFERSFGKKYEAEERARRFSTFTENFLFVQAAASENTTYEVGLNGHTDLSQAEFVATRLGLRRPGSWGGLPHLGTAGCDAEHLPQSVDWRARGALTPVENQGSCGACWAFSATGAISAAWKIATGNLTQLSVQQFMDCSRNFNQGCAGGSMDPAFSFAHGAALCTAASYPYLGRQLSCRATSGTCDIGIPLGGVLGYRDVVTGSAAALMNAVLHQPVSVGIEADDPHFRFYLRGVFSGACGADPNHGVLLVGYGVADGVPYWLLKNSWGPDWGEAGYFKLLRKASGPGECGVMVMPSFPVVQGAHSHIQLEVSPPAENASTSAPSSTSVANLTSETTTTPQPTTTPRPYYYGPPPCRADEVVARLRRAGRAQACAPTCDGDRTCPLEMPPGSTANPVCAFRSAKDGRRYCALLCASTMECPTGGRCFFGRGTRGICLYPAVESIAGGPFSAGAQDVVDEPLVVVPPQRRLQVSRPEVTGILV